MYQVDLLQHYSTDDEENKDETSNRSSWYWHCIYLHEKLDETMDGNTWGLHQVSKDKHQKEVKTRKHCLKLKQVKYIWYFKQQDNDKQEFRTVGHITQVENIVTSILGRNIKEDHSLSYRWWRNIKNSMWNQDSCWQTI